MASTIFLHSGGLPVVCSCAKTRVPRVASAPDSLGYQSERGWRHRTCQHTRWATCSLQRAPWHTPPLPSQLDGQQEGHRNTPADSFAAGECPSSSPGQPRMLSACWPGLGVVLPPEGRRSGEQRGSAALASPPGMALSCHTSCCQMAQPFLQPLLSLGG